MTDFGHPAGFERPAPHPFVYAQPYNPAASMGLDVLGAGGPVMGALATQYLQQFAGPTNFLPNQFPGQAGADQLVMRDYFNRTRQNIYGTNQLGNQPFANVLLGMRGFTTNAPASDLNRRQALNLAQTFNDPTIKGMVGMMIGPENLEALMFGSRGDPMAIADAVNRIGYYRRDPATGSERMSAQALESFSRSVYSQLYQPEGSDADITDLAAGARAGDAEKTRELKQIARAENERLVEDTEVGRRIIGLGDDRVTELYKKYQPEGKAVTSFDRAQELIRFDRAVQEANVMRDDEVTYGGLERRAKRAGLEQMHGFSAGQTSQIMESLFQRGMLPQSIGAMSAADRVKILANENINDETLTRLAKEFGGRDLAENVKDKEYLEALGKGDTAAQDKILGRHLDDYKSRIQTSMRAIKENAGTVNPDDLLKLDGIDSVASNVDARRAGDVIKKHTGAIAAIREIFGDSGNTNAPVPALLAALEHLSQGSTNQVGVNRVESVLREMRGTAKSLGMGFNQLAGFSAQIGAYGDTLGLSGPSKMNAVNEALTAVKVMNQSGAFSTTRYGSMNQQEAYQKMGMIAARGEGSNNAKSVAALVRAYEVDPQKFAGTELEAVVQQLKNPGSAGQYAVKDAAGNVTASGNIYQQLGRGGYLEAARIAAAAGIDQQSFLTLHSDSGTLEFAQSGAALKTMRAEYTDRLSNNAIKGFLTFGADRIDDPANKLRGNTTAAKNTQQLLSTKMAEVLLDTAHMKDAERIEHINKTLEDSFTDAIIQDAERRGITITDDARTEARKQAGFGVQALLGTDPEKRQQRTLSLIAGTNRASEHLYNMNMVQANQAFGGDRVQQFITAQQVRADDAKRRKEAGLGFEGTPLQRLSDYLAETGLTGEAVTQDNFIKALTGIVPNAELRKQIAGELLPEFSRLSTEIAESQVTEDYLKNLHENAQKGDAKSITDLKALASRTETGKKLAAGELVTDEALSKKRGEKLAVLSDAEVTNLYKKKGAGSADGRSVAAMREELETVDLSQEDGFKTTQLLSENQFTIDQLAQEAARVVGQERGTAAEEREKNKARIASARIQQAGMYAKTKEDVRKGVGKLIDDVTGGKVQGEAFNELITLGLKEGDDKDAGVHSKEFLAKVDQLGLGDEAKKKLLDSVAAKRHSAKIELAKYGLSPENVGTGPEAAAAHAEQQKEVPGANDLSAGAKAAGDSLSALDGAIKTLTETTSSFNTAFNELIPALKSFKNLDGPEAAGPGQVSQTKAETRRINTQSTPPVTVAARSGGEGTTKISGVLRIANMQTAVLEATGPQIHVGTEGGPAIPADAGTTSYA